MFDFDGDGVMDPGEEYLAFRIDHPHYMDPDDCECSRCGARFPEKQMECPVCGARFGTATTDDGEFMEEMEIWDGDDD